MRNWRLIATASLIAASALIDHGARAQSEAMSKPGAHLVLSLDTDDLRTHWLGSMRDEIRSRLREAKLGFSGLAVAENAVQVRLAKPEDADAALKVVADLAPAAPSGIVERCSPPYAGYRAAMLRSPKVRAGSSPSRRPWRGSSDAERGARRRGGGRRPAARWQGGCGQRRAPGARSHPRACARSAGDGRTEGAAGQAGATRLPRSACDAQSGGGAPGARAGGLQDLSVREQPHSELLREAPVVRGNDLVDAQATFDQRTSEPAVAFRFNSAGARTFGRYTTENIGRPFAIVLDEWCCRRQ